MRLFRHLQPWLTGGGPHLQVADVVPHPHPIRQWAETFPWPALVEAIDRSCAQRFPKTSRRGRPPISTRVLRALAWLKHAVGGSDAQMGSRVRTDFAVLYACGLPEVHADPTHAHGVLPAVLAPFRSRIAPALLDALMAIQAAAALDEGLVSPAPLLVDPVPAEQGSQRGTDATTRSKAQKTSSSSSRPSRRKAPRQRSC